MGTSSRQSRCTDAGRSADLGYTTGSLGIRYKSSDGTPVARKGGYVTICRKQPDGGWKIALDIGGFVPPKPAAPSGATQQTELGGSPLA